MVGDIIKEDLSSSNIQKAPVVNKKFQQEVKHYQKLFDELRYEVSKIVVGQSDILDFLMEYF